MKKIVSMILSIAILCSMATFVAAADTDISGKDYYYDEIMINDISNKKSDASYINVQRFGENRAPIYDKNAGKWYFCCINEDENVANCYTFQIEETGESVTEFEYAAPYTEGKAVVGIIKNGKLELSILDSEGYFVPLCIIKEKSNEEKTDENTIEKIPFTVEKNIGKYFDKATSVNDANKAAVMPFAYNDGYLCLPNDEGGYSMFDKNGVFVASEFVAEGEKTYKVKGLYSEGLVACATDSGEYAFFDISGNLVINLGSKYACLNDEYSITSVYPFDGGFSCLRLQKSDGKKAFAIIRRITDEDNKEHVIAGACNRLMVRYIVGKEGQIAINNGVVVYEDPASGLWGTMRIKNDEAQDIPTSYKYLSAPSNGAMLAQNQQGKYGLITIKGNVILPFEYETGETYINNTIFLTKNGQVYLYEYDGKKIYTMNVRGNSDFYKIYRGDAGIVGAGSSFETKVVYVEKDNKYSFARLIEPSQYAKFKGEFPDVAKSSKQWFFDDLMAAYNAGLINGKNQAGEFKPDDLMSYAEAIKLAACLHQWSKNGGVTLKNGSPWYQPYVEYCRENGIITRTASYTYDAPATRAGYMNIFANALPDDKLLEINRVDDEAIPDMGITVDNPVKPSVYKLYRAGIVAGSDTEHNCNPDVNIKRSEVVTILARMMFPEKRIKFTLTNETSGGDTGAVVPPVGGNAVEPPAGSSGVTDDTAAAPLVIKTQPESVAVKEGQEAKISVEAEGGSGEYTYQWFMVGYGQTVQCSDNAVMNGTNTNTLTIQTVNTEATFYCQVADKAKPENTIKTQEVTVKIITE